MYHSLELGTKVPDFSLIGADGFIHTLGEFKGSRALVIMFLCNHCPYVQGSLHYLKQLAKTYQKRGVAFIAIHSNRARTSEDSYEMIVNHSISEQLPWISLHDASQQIALKFGALVTPHYFLFDHHKHLIYSGKAVDNPKFPEKSSQDFLTQALEQHLDTQPITISETDPIGCTLKWENSLSKETCLIF